MTWKKNFFHRRETLSKRRRRRTRQRYKWKKIFFKRFSAKWVRRKCSLTSDAGNCWGLITTICRVMCFGFDFNLLALSEVEHSRLYDSISRQYGMANINHFHFRRNKVKSDRHCWKPFARTERTIFAILDLLIGIEKQPKWLHLHSLSRKKNPFRWKISPSR